MAQMVKNPPAIRETWVRSLGWEDPWRREWRPTPVFFPGESSWTEEPGGLQSMGLQSQTQLSNLAQHRHMVDLQCSVGFKGTAE